MKIDLKHRSAFSGTRGIVPTNLFYTETSMQNFLLRWKWICICDFLVNRFTIKLNNNNDLQFQCWDYTLHASIVNWHKFYIWIRKTNQIVAYLPHLQILRWYWVMLRRLPPLNALKAFEAAARNLSFTKAADELFVTQAAISHQIKSLEDFLSMKLFPLKRIYLNNPTH